MKKAPKKRPTLQSVLDNSAEPQELTRALRQVADNYSLSIEHGHLLVKPREKKSYTLEDIASLLAGSLGHKGNPKLVFEIGVAHKNVDENEVKVKLVCNGKKIKSWNSPSAEYLDSTVKWIYDDIQHDLMIYGKVVEED